MVFHSGDILMCKYEHLILRTRLTYSGAEIKDWYSEPSSGLSGGEIAGIVVSHLDHSVDGQTGF